MAPDRLRSPHIPLATLLCNPGWWYLAQSDPASNPALSSTCRTPKRLKMKSIITIDDVRSDPNKIKAMIRARGGSDKFVDLLLIRDAEVNDANLATMRAIFSAESLPQQLPPEIKLGTYDSVKANQNWLKISSSERDHLIDRINDLMH
jgi:hypothetical protein